MSRSCYDAGAVIGVEPIRAGIGLEVGKLQIALSPLTPHVALLLRGHDARLRGHSICRIGAKTWRCSSRMIAASWRSILIVSIPRHLLCG